MSDAPILYSFRRCPYAMRARMSLLLAGHTVRLRELVLRDKPAHMLEVSPKGSVPVLILEDDTVVDESLDVMLWSLGQHDPDGILGMAEEREQMLALIAENDGPFKHHLDRYKYATRYEDVDETEHRAAGYDFLKKLETRLKKDGQLFGPAPKLADYAIFPFVRQFRIADMDWFDDQDLPALHPWLQTHMNSPIFKAIMTKFDLWNDTQIEHEFGPGLLSAA